MIYGGKSGSIEIYEKLLENLSFSPETFSRKPHE